MRPAELFANNLNKFFVLMKELLGICCDYGNRQVKPEWMDIVSMFVSSFPPDKLMEYFIEYSFLPIGNDKVCIWEKIKVEDENFMIENAHILFRDLTHLVSADKVQAFKVLFTTVDAKGNPVIDPADRKLIWDYLHANVKFTLLHIHQQRCPKTKTLEDGTTKPVYTREYRRDIDLKKYLALYPDLKLEW